MSNPQMPPSMCLSPVAPDSDLEIWNCIEPDGYEQEIPPWVNPFDKEEIFNVEHSFEAPFDNVPQQAPEHPMIRVVEPAERNELSNNGSSSTSNPDDLVTSFSGSFVEDPVYAPMDAEFNLRLEIEGSQPVDETITEVRSLSPSRFYRILEESLVPQNEQIRLIDDATQMDVDVDDYNAEAEVVSPSQETSLVSAGASSWVVEVQQNGILVSFAPNAATTVPSSSSFEDIMNIVGRILPEGSKPEVVGNLVPSSDARTRGAKPVGSKRTPPPDPKLTYGKENAFDSIDTAHKMRNLARFLLDAAEYRHITCLRVSSVVNVRAIERTRYLRDDIHKYVQDHGDFLYLPYEDFNKEDLYSPQFYRVRMDVTRNYRGEVQMAPFNNTRHALCPYCPRLAFFDLKTTAYGQHLAYHHGVYLSGFLAPDPLYYGMYALAKPNPARQTKAHIRIVKAVVCPACHEVVEVESNKMTRNVQPLYNYLRHFKQMHRKSSQQTSEKTFFNRTIPF